MRFLGLTLVLLTAAILHGGEAPQPTAADSIIKELKRLEASDAKIYSPDRKSYLVNKDDEKGVPQIYVGKAGSDEIVCITDKQQPNGPKPDRLKAQAHWHPNGKWIFLAAERDQYNTPPILGNDRKFVEGQLQCGIWTNMYAVSPDGKVWHRLTDYKSGVAGVPDGFTGVAITPDGKHGVWSEIVNGNIFQYWPFGKWDLILADYAEKDGKPVWINKRNITPKDMFWNEPGNFAPDNVSLLISGSTEKDQQGMDQYILNINTGKLTNLTKTPNVWDEHGVFSPDGEKIIFMSAYPYREDPNTSKVLSIKTEFMLINKDGSGLTQLTHYFEEGYPEAGRKGIAACAEWHPDGKSALLTTLVFPKYELWELIFKEAIGNRKR